jgi:hypothetical protein
MMNTKKKKKIPSTTSYLTMGFLSTHKPPTLRRPTTTLVKETNTTTHKWASFTYIGKGTTFITNLFKKTDLKVAWLTTNTIQELLMPQHQSRDKYARSGAYKLTCPDCNKAYVGQTGHSFAMRFKEHKYAFKTNNHTSYYAKHISEQSHSFGPIHDTMQILQYQNKGNHLNTIERFYIYTEVTKNNHSNDEYNISPNKIFNALLYSNKTKQ